MKFPALASSIALASALALSGGAFAQSEETMMIGEQSFSGETETAQVMNFCRDLMIDDLGAAPNEMAEDDAAEESTGIAELTSNVDYSTITIEQCETTFADMMDEDGMIMMDDSMMEETPAQ